MIAADPQKMPEPVVGRRAADTLGLSFRGAERKSVELKTPVADDEVEIINLDEVLPPGSDEDFRHDPSVDAPPRSPLTPELRKQQIQLATLKRSFEEFKVTEHLSWINISDIKRGDVLAIKTIVGCVYLQVIERIKGAGAGEALCECHYDLGDQSVPAHVASIQLPICARNHLIANPDGSKRQASRKLKMVTEAILPPHLGTLLQEQFFVEIMIHAHPQPERLRFIDLWRGIARVFYWIKAVIEKNNRIEREKKQRKEEEKRQKQEERARKKQEKLEAKESKEAQRFRSR